MIGVAALVATPDIVTPAIVAILATAATSAVAGFFNRPKTKAEADERNAAASVSMSAESREWTRLFVERAEAAEARAAKAERHADEATAIAEAASERADAFDAGLIEAYGYVMQLREEIVRLGGQAIPPPARLEALWRTR